MRVKLIPQSLGRWSTYKKQDKPVVFDLMSILFLLFPPHLSTRITAVKAFCDVIQVYSK